MLPRLDLDHDSAKPLYRQLYEQLRSAIIDGRMVRGERLPATRELAGSIGLNRTTVSAAYDLLESERLIRAEVGRGSFVEGPAEHSLPPRLNWESLIPPEQSNPAQMAPNALVSFSASRPPEMLFPLDEFRATCREVIDSAEAAQILQLGPAAGYEPLRKHLLNEARKRGNATRDDDILITSGCQQAFDLIQRILASRGETVLLEDPVYPGLRDVFLRGGARVIGVPVNQNGLDVEALARILETEKPRVLVITPNFQNPTGTTMPGAARKTVLALARRAGIVLVENNLYGDLRYVGSPIPSIKHFDSAGDTILLGSFSKIAFPGLRVGWAIGPRHFIERLTEAKQASDLHSDQLSQAVLLRFAESGRLQAHREKMLAAGAQRLQTVLGACHKELPSGAVYTKPEGGMNVWVDLPRPVDASELAHRAEPENVSFLPGRYFSVSRPHTQGMRLSFIGLSPHQIKWGMAVLGMLIRSEATRVRKKRDGDPVPALV